VLRGAGTRRNAGDGVTGGTKVRPRLDLPGCARSVGLEAVRLRGRRTSSRADASAAESVAAADTAAASSCAGKSKKRVQYKGDRRRV